MEEVIVNPQEKITGKGALEVYLCEEGNWYFSLRGNPWRWQVSGDYLAEKGILKNKMKSARVHAPSK